MPDGTREGKQMALSRARREREAEGRVSDNASHLLVVVFHFLKVSVKHIVIGRFWR
jgi:hypothetical protein